MQTAADLPQIDWHVPRQAEARRALDALFQGPAKAFRLFGPRRIGKTWFLLLDIAPAAIARGHHIVYADFWRGTDVDPAELLLTEIEQSEERGYLTTMLTRIKTAALKGAGFGASLEFHKEAETAPTADKLARALDRLADTNRPALLLLDEFQRVSQAPNGEDFIAILRAALTRHPDGLRAIFTGSSQAGLNRIFSAKDAPFFRHADRLELEPLGRLFVEAQLERMQKTSSAVVDLDAALEIFEHYDRSPMWLNRWITKLIVNPSLSPREAQIAIENDVARDNDFDVLLDGLSGPQREALWLIAMREFGTTGAPARTAIADQGRPKPSKSRLDSGRQRLEARGLLEKDASGRWRLDNSLLEDWIRRQPPAEILGPPD